MHPAQIWKPISRRHEASYFSPGGPFQARLEVTPMKQFVFGFCAVLLLRLGSVRTAYAQHWVQPTGPGPKGAGADTRMEWPKWPKLHIERSHQEKLRRSILLRSSPAGGRKVPRPWVRHRATDKQVATASCVGRWCWLGR